MQYNTVHEISHFQIHTHTNKHINGDIPPLGPFNVNGEFGRAYWFEAPYDGTIYGIRIYDPFCEYIQCHTRNKYRYNNLTISYNDYFDMPLSPGPTNDTENNNGNNDNNDNQEYELGSLWGCDDLFHVTMVKMTGSETFGDYQAGTQVYPMV